MSILWPAGYLVSYCYTKLNCVCARRLLSDSGMKPLKGKLARSSWVVVVVWLIARGYKDRRHYHVRGIFPFFFIIKMPKKDEYKVFDSCAWDFSF